MAVTTDRGIPVPFDAHVELLHSFVRRRDALVERIQDLLNAQYRPERYLRDRAALSEDFEQCFFAHPDVGVQLAERRGELDEAHWSGGFRPREIPGLHNDLIAPAEMMIRAFYCWQQTKWPTRKARTRYAHALFDVYLLRCLQLLAMRVWDDGAAAAGDRLAQVQRVLDALAAGTPSDLPVHVRDARWLIPLALSPTTDDLGAYFSVAENVATSFSPADRLEIHKAAVQMIGGHLRSQIRHYCLSDGVSIDEPSVVVRTRTSNALDLALLVQGLVPLLAEYARARNDADDATRLLLANAILQGISPDPELFVNRLDLLLPYSMTDYLFVATDAQGRADYTPMGRRHVELFDEYATLIGSLVGSLREDCAQFRPAAGSYSPFGAIYGTPSNLLEHIALKTITANARADFSLHDVFTDGGADKLEWVNGWRRLPHIPREVEKLHRYPQAFASEIFVRIEHALNAHADGVTFETGRVFTSRLDVGAGDGEADRSAGLPERPGAPARAALPVRYVISSDTDVVAAGRAIACEQDRLLRDRREGHYIVSQATAGGWLAVRKDFLTELLAAGTDVEMPDLPEGAAAVLRLMCPALYASAPPSMLNA